MAQQDLEALFSPFGRIITSRILCDNITGKCIYLHIRNFVNKDDMLNQGDSGTEKACGS